MFLMERMSSKIKKVEAVSVQVQFVNRGDPLWVLSLSGDSWMAPVLRLGSSAELEDFFYNIGPTIRNTRRRGPRVKKDDPEQQSAMDYPLHSSISEAKKDFMMMINKFGLSSNIEPDAYITDDTHILDDSPSITLHFKGLYTVLIVESGGKEWNYFINSRSSLPEWFYEKHDPHDSPIPIPEDVLIQLFSSLWRLLHLFFGFPV